MSNQEWQATIGLEIHAQLKTRSKIFSADSTEFGGADNAHVSPVSLGMPGTLPVMNKQVVNLAIKAGLALGCEIREKSIFARKNYFYPDLPKGYQISQYDQPICENGKVEIKMGGQKKMINIERAHLEEDAGKSTHHGQYSLINLNRAGVPLLEIVSAPDITSAQEAAEYARVVRSILRYVNVCDGNLEEGSLRCDCNVSIKKAKDKELGTKVEIKNINSFRFIEKAIEHEIQRQIDAVESGEEIVQETRLYDSVKNKTFSMRKKEEAHDYRYFPDPDLTPLVVSADWVRELKEELPELPLAKAERFEKGFGLSESDAQLLTQEIELADYYERVVGVCNNPKSAAAWVLTELMRELNDSKTDVQDSPITAKSLGELIELIDNKTISGKIAKQVFAEMWSTQKLPSDIVSEKGMSQITDEKEIEAIVEKVLSENQGQVDQYKSGKEKVFGFFVGKVMKETKGKANPELVNKLIKKGLKK